MDRLFFDMDGVLVDFNGYVQELNRLEARIHMDGAIFMPPWTGETVKKMRGAYLDMQPIAGAIEGVRSAIGMGFDVWLATKPPTGIAFAYADKAAWVFKHLPELKRKLIVTHDKGMLGDYGDILVDDRPHKANCCEFRGTLVPFAAAPESWSGRAPTLRTEPVGGWAELLGLLTNLSPQLRRKSA